MDDTRKMQLNKLVNKAFRLENIVLHMGHIPVDRMESHLSLETNMVITNNTDTKEEYDYVMNRLANKINELPSKFN